MLFISFGVFCYGQIFSVNKPSEMRLVLEDEKENVRTSEYFFYHNGAKASMVDPINNIWFQDTDGYTCVITYEILDIEMFEFSFPLGERKIGLFKRTSNGWISVSDKLYTAFSYRDSIFEFVPYTVLKKSRHATSYVLKMNDNVFVIFLTIHTEYNGVDSYYNDIIFFIKNGNKFNHTIFSPLNKKTPYPEIVPKYPMSHEINGNNIKFNLTNEKELNFEVYDNEVYYSGDIKFNVIK